MKATTDLIGRFVKDPEMKTGKSGNNYTKFTLACDNGFGKNKGTYFASCTAFGKLAEIINDYAQKGKLAFVYGELSRNEDWTDNNGNKVKGTTQITVKDFKILSPKNENSTQTQPKTESRTTTVKELEEQQKIEEKAHKNMVDERQEQIQESDFEEVPF